MKRLALAAVVLILLLASCASAPEKEAYGEVSMGAAEAESTASVTEPYLTVRDQAIANSSIIVPAVYYDGPGWIVIHKVVDGKPGPVVGWAAVKPGLNSDIRVLLSDASAPEYIAMLHIDAGVMYVYEFPGADLPFKAGDAILMKKFAVQK